MLGEPDCRTNNHYELARRDGMIFLTLPDADVRIAFVYTDYPLADSFLRTVWFTLLWSLIKRGEAQQEPNFDYGVRWSLRNMVTAGMLIHEMGIEPNMSLEIVVHH